MNKNVVDARLRMQDSRYKIQDAGCKMLIMNYFPVFAPFVVSLTVAQKNLDAM
ncbi:MAG TPA: hypothetical protein VFG11_00020 [Acidobacteriota bacterium]|nr:hypothetical protein [Acidobacteriota bacterium]